MSLTATQNRLMANLVAAIYGIANALIPVIDHIAAQTTRPWNERARFESRFYAIIRELLALTARIRPATLSPNPTFPAAPPRPTTQTARPRPTLRRPAHPRAPARLLSARQLAQRLANLLRQLERLALEAGTALAAPIRHLADQARTIAGCNALPTPTPSWERAG